MALEGRTDERLDDLSSKFDRLDERMEDGFRDLRAEMNAQSGALRNEMNAQGKDLRADMATEFRAIRADIGAMNRWIQQLAFGLIGALLVGSLGTTTATPTLV
jgi:hypothetical protein